jgi:4'-phosphopantetheinyl transferase
MACDHCTVPTVHVVDLRLAPDAQARAYEVLSGEERARADRLASGAARRRYVAARAALREHLAGELGVAAADVSLRAGRWGKPEVAAHHGLQFSLAHCGDLAVLALRRGGALGVDVEALAHRERWPALLDRISAPSERTAARADAERRGPVAFYERWVAKEAVVKALGRGLTLPLAQVVLRRDAEHRLVLAELCGSAPSAARWELRALDVGEGFVGAIVLAAQASASHSPSVP